MSYDPSIDIRITDNYGDGVTGLTAASITLHKKEDSGTYNALTPITDYTVVDVSPEGYNGLFRITPASASMSTGYYKIKYANADILGYVDILYIREFPIPIEHGGTGATTALGARTNLGLVPGVDIMPFDNNLNVFLQSTPAEGIVTKNGTTYAVKSFTNIVSEAGGDTSTTAAWKYHVGPSVNEIVKYGDNGELKLPVYSNATQPSTAAFNVGDMLLWTKPDNTGTSLLVCSYSGTGSKVWHTVFEYNYTPA